MSCEDENIYNGVLREFPFDDSKMAQVFIGIYRTVVKGEVSLGFDLFLIKTMLQFLYLFTMLYMYLNTKRKKSTTS